MAILTINTQLLDGELEGSRIIYSGSRMCKMFVAPRERVLDVAKDIPHQYGLYILLGKSENGNPRAYVGQTKDFQQRVRDHLVKKEFWDTAMVFISKANEIYASEVLYLEFLGIQKAIECGQYDMDENVQIPPKPSLAPEKEIEMEQFFEEIQFFIKFFGCSIFEKKGRKKRVKNLPPVPPTPPTPPSPVAQNVPVQQNGDFHDFAFSIPKAEMSARLRLFPKTNKYVILADSLIAAEDGPSLQASIADFRRNLFGSPKVTKTGHAYKLLEDIEIPGSSPSAAAKFCAGTSRNGKTDWKDASGTTIGEFLESLQ